MACSPYTALLMAGSRGPTDVVASHCGVSHKALAPIGGRPMIEHVLEALCRASEVGKIVAVIESPDALRKLAMVQELERGGRLALTRARPSPSQSVLAALDEHTPYPALVTTADHPLLEPAMITEFLSRIPDGVDVAALVARDSVIRAAYPDAARTYLRFTDAAVSGCNLFAVTNPRGRDAVLFWQRLEKDRKRPWRMAMALGPGTLLRFALRRLSSSAAAQAVGRQAGVRAALVESSHANAAVDVDKVSDYELVDGLLRRSA